jgi:hypothetical protein
LLRISTEKDMAELLRAFAEPIGDAAGLYHARVVGRHATDGMWEGWLEFVPDGDRSAQPPVTAVESRQPEREHLAYWASGLSEVCAEGALARALHPVIVTHVVERAASTARAQRQVRRITR